MAGSEHHPREHDEAALFVRQARDVAHHALYFLYHFRREPAPALAALYAQDRAQLVDHVRLLVRSVQVPPALSPPAPPGPAPRPLAPDPEFPDRRLRGIVFERPPPAAISFAEVAAFWATEVRDALADGGPLSLAEIEVVIGRLQKFLTLSRPLSGTSPLGRAFGKAKRVAGRHALLLLGLVVTAFVYGQVEAIRNLRVNMPPRTTLLPFGLVAFGAAVIGFFDFHRHLGFGKGAFWRLAYEAVVPRGQICMLSGTRAVGRVIGGSEAYKMVVMLLWLTTCGLLIWALGADAGAPSAGWRPDRTAQTLFLLNAIFVCALIGLHWLDQWDFLDQRPIRAIAFVALAVLGAASLSQYWAALQLYLLAAPVATLLVLLRRMVRQRRIGFGRGIGAAAALLAVAFLVVGVRTRARGVWGRDDGVHVAVAAAKVAAGQWPAGGAEGPPVVLVAASGGGSRAAVYTAYLFQQLHRELPDVAHNIQAISSVSGGSLATAAYIALRRSGADLGAKSNSSAPTAAIPDGPLVKAVAHDFLLPTLRGALLPFLSRGEAIEQAFSRDAQLGSLRLHDLARAWNAAAASPRFPLPLFNACTLDGHAVVLSPLHETYYVAPRDVTGTQLRNWYGLPLSQELTWVHDRDRIVPFEHINATYSPSLAEAVRASANFPFGFPLVEVKKTVFHDPALPDKGEVELTDGGVLSNSGLWSLYHLMMSPGSGGKTLEQLRRRGVLLLVVDASHMPEYAADRRDLLSLYGAIADQAPIAQNLHRRMFELLEREYRDRLAIVQVDLVPTPEENVLTTWALDERSLAKLRESFARVWVEQPGRASLARTIAEHWKALSRSGPGEVANRGLRPRGRVRVPLD